MRKAPHTLLEAVDRLAAADLDHLTLRAEASEALRRHVDFDVGVWATIDPTTVMTTHCLLDGMPRDAQLESDVFRNEYQDDDVLKAAEMARSSLPAGSLLAATGGEPARSPRLSELYVPRGIDDELRAVFVDGGTPWGAAYLLRAGAPFGEEEVARVAAVGPPLARALRRAMLRSAVADPGDLSDPPGLMTLDEHGAVTWISDEAAQLLRGLPVDEAATAARALQARHAAGLPASTAIPAPDGRWLGMHAVGPGGQQIVVEQPRPFELADLIVRAHGLTLRERRIVECLARGLSTRAIAEALHISEWTVQDHLKAIFAKFGVNSRAEVVSRVFFDHYAPRHEDGSRPSPYGWFIG